MTSPVDPYAEMARDWMRRQPVQSPDAAERAANDAQLVGEAFEIIQGLDYQLDILWRHLEKAREAIANAQQWSDKWQAHAFQMKSRADQAESQRDALTTVVRDIVAQWVGAEWCDDAVQLLDSLATNQAQMRGDDDSWKR